MYIDSTGSHHQIVPNLSLRLRIFLRQQFERSGFLDFPVLAKDTHALLKCMVQIYILRLIQYRHFSRFLSQSSPSSIFSSASSMALPVRRMDSGSVYSCGQWLFPPTLRVKIIPPLVTRCILAASCPAMLTST